MEGVAPAVKAICRFEDRDDGLNPAGITGKEARLKPGSTGGQVST